MPEVVAKQLFEYAGRLRTPGERFTVEDRFVRILTSLGRIESPSDPAPKSQSPASPPASGQAYETRQMVAAEPVRARRKRISIVAQTRAARAS